MLLKLGLVLVNVEEGGFFFFESQLISVFGGILKWKYKCESFTYFDAVRRFTYFDA